MKTAFKRIKTILMWIVLGVSVEGKGMYFSEAQDWEII